jgi:hypothetical protein
MNTNKAVYFIALGVLALGLRSEYRQGNFVAAHRVVERTGSLLCQLSTRAELALVSAKLATRGEERAAISVVAPSDTADLVRDQGELVREQVREQAEMIRDRVREQVLAQRELIRAQAEIRRAAEDQMRLRSQMGLVSVVNGRMKVDCPKTTTRVVIGNVTDLDDISPDVEVQVDDNL